MIKCEDCGRCQSIHLKDGVYGIVCDKNGEMMVHSSHSGAFSCPSGYEKRKQPAEPQKDNAMVVLKSGRDFMVFDDGIHSEGDICSRMAAETGRAAYFRLGGIWFAKDEIAAYAYIGG